VPEPADLTVVVLSWNTRDLTVRALAAVPAACAPFRAKVVCVDNASRDGSAAAVRAALPGVLVIENEANLGFARGNNVALRAVEGRAVCFLNSDTEASPGSLGATLAYLDAHPRVGIACPPLVYGDGSRQRSAWGVPTVPSILHQYTPLGWVGFGASERRRVREVGWNVHASGPVECVAGACLVIRRDLCERFGGFDPGYPFYHEDVDLCLRARQAGWEVHVVHDAPRVVHVGGVSARLAKGATHVRFVQGTMRLQRKRLSPLAFAVFGCAFKIGLLWRTSWNLAHAPLRYALRRLQGRHERARVSMLGTLDHMHLLEHDLVPFVRAWGEARPFTPGTARLARAS
jgi:GT2 family glycosyltransferase